MSTGKLTADEVLAAARQERVKKVEEALTPAGAHVKKAQERVSGDAPFVKSGRVYEDSRRFSLTNWLVNGMMGRDSDKAAFEMDAMRKLRKAMVETNNNLQCAPGGAFWLPLSWEMLGDEVNQHKDATYCKSVLAASGGQGYDPDEADWLLRRGFISRKAMSAYRDATGGTLVAPPAMGEVIPYVRPNAAFLKAGAQSVALPPQGRLVRPRITSATIAEALGEAQATPESDVSTDEMVLQAKKIAGAVRINEEATAFTSSTIDSLMQADLGRTLGLKMDAYAFYGPGGTAIPAGLTSAAYSSAIVDIATTYSTAAGIGVNGNDLLPEYGDRIPTLIEERSFGVDSDEGGAWVMRPAALSRARSLRTDAVVPGDERGPFVELLKKFADSQPEQFGGRRVVKTTNLKNNLTKGTADDLSDVFYGLWKYAVMATYGALQFTQGHDGNTFLNGQYLIRALMWGDVGFEYPQAFAWYTKVKGATGLIS
jgi:HK97 family phage major capsid protein